MAAIALSFLALEIYALLTGHLTLSRVVYREVLRYPILAPLGGFVFGRLTYHWFGI